MCLNERMLGRRLLLGGALLGTGLCVAISGAGAYPATAPLWGPSGLGIIPTSETVDEGTIEAGLGYESVNPAGGDVRFLPVVSGTYGFDRGEIGAGYLRERVTGGGVTLNSDYFIVHGKYRLLNQPGGAQIAAGAHYLKFDSNTGGGVTSVYLVGSYPFLQQKLFGHAGLLYQRTSSGGFSSNEVRPMVGAEWRANDKVRVVADWLPKKGVSVSAASLAARYEHPKGWGAQIGVGQFRGDDTKIFVSGTYRFNVRPKTKTAAMSQPVNSTKAEVAP